MSTSLSFPPQADPPLRKEALVEYIKGFNKQRTGARLHIWSSSARPHDGELPSPVVIRYTIRDILVVYLTLGCIDPDSTLAVEDATAFGPREKVEPISRANTITWTASDPCAETAPFAIRLYRLSEAIAANGQDAAERTAGVLPADSGAYSACFLRLRPPLTFLYLPLQKLLTSYEDLFVRQCTACQRVLSAEGHVPPVARVWLLPSQESSEGSWDARHPDCMQS